MTNRLYDYWSSNYRLISERRTRYLSSVDEEILKTVCRQRPASWLDVGAGDGRRIHRLTSLLQDNNIRPAVSLIEPAASMRLLLRSQMPESSVYDRIEHISPSATFDMVTLLWNVVGHLNLHETLSKLAPLLSSGGIVMFDANCRYNAKEYGYQRAARNMVQDVLRRSRSSGVDFSIRYVGGDVPVSLHTKKSIQTCLNDCGFRIEQMLFVNYTNGLMERSQFGGQILCTAKVLRT